MRNSDLELYTDSLLSTFGAATATELSAMVRSEVGHDRSTRLLSRQAYTSKDLWLQVMARVRNVQSDEGALIFDDTIDKRTTTASRAATGMGLNALPVALPTLPNGRLDR